MENKKRHSTEVRSHMGIVLVHGIVGNNRIFDFLVSFLPDECMVRYVDLDGHGGDALAFSRTSMSKWKRQVEAAVVEMAGMCETVIGVGHSMGCLLLLGEDVRKRLDGLFLMNPPLRIRLRMRLLSNALKVALDRTEGDMVASAAKVAYGVSVDYNPFHYYGWPMRYLELFAEIRRIRRSLSEEVSCHVTAALSEIDEMVSVTSREIIENIKDAKVILLPRSSHYFYSCEDQVNLCYAFTELISELVRIPKKCHE